METLIALRPQVLEQMCDPAQVFMRRPFHAINRTVCALRALPTTSAIECHDVVLQTSYTISLSDQPVSIFGGFGFVCWTDQDGNASCSDGASVPSIRVADIQRIDQRFSLLNDSEFVSQSAAQPYNFTFPQEPGSLLTIGPFSACVVLPSSQSSFSCQTSITDVDNSSLTTNPAGFYGSPLADFRLNTTTVWWTNEAHSISWFGVPGCGGTATYCSSASAGDVGIFDIPVGLQATRVSPGFLQVCAVTPEGSVSCWGSYSAYKGWESLSGVWDVFTYQSGACAVFQSFSSATCWGQFSHTFPLTYENNCVPCTSDTSIIFNSACLGCGYGSESSFSTLSQSAWCVPCPPLYVRGATDSVCVQCGEGSQTNQSLTQCVACGPSSYRSQSMASCSECGLGSQSLPGFTSCTSCSLGLFRSASMLSCSQCPAGSLPNANQTACEACPLPQYCSFSTGSLTFADCLCVACPEGTEVSGFGCASCTAPRVRLNPSQTCYNCPEGTEPNSSFTLCIPCTGNFIRTNPTGYCFACPTNTIPNASHTRCESVFRPIRIDAMQYVLLAVGILLFAIAWGLSSFSPAAAMTATVLGLLLIAFGIGWQATLEKNN